ncbi:hypothetical protein HAX54_028616, partial [Datura stramonium]|nr:hypothetical protein [Datura stramonium]
MFGPSHKLGLGWRHNLTMASSYVGVRIVPRRIKIEKSAPLQKDREELVLDRIRELRSQARREEAPSGQAPRHVNHALL